MSNEPAQLIESLQTALPGAEVEIKDPRGDGEILQVDVTYGGFAGISLQDQHRAIYKIIADTAPSLLERVSIKTKMPSAP